MTDIEKKALALLNECGWGAALNTGSRFIKYKHERRNHSSPNGQRLYPAQHSKETAMTSETKRASLAASPLSDEPRQKRETPRLQPLATNRHRASQLVETAMTSELRPAVEVATDCYEQEFFGIEAAAAVIEADREAVRAEQAAELAKFKALAETLAGALGPFAEEWNEREFLAECHWSVYWEASKALRQYKEARDA